MRVVNPQGNSEMLRANRPLVLLVVALAAGLWSACTDSPTEPVVVATVAISPTQVTIESGASTTLSAQARTAKGGVLDGRIASWSSGDTEIATVNPSGIVTAGLVLSGAPRTTSVTAVIEGASGVSTVTVTPVPVGTIVIDRDSLMLVPGGTMQLAAETKSAAGQTLTGRSQLWSTLNVDIATVSASGLVTASPYSGASQRVARIVVTSEGKADTSVVVVTPLAAARVVLTPDSVSVVSGASTTLVARIEDALGGQLSGRTVIWESTDSAVVSVSSDGVVGALPYTDPVVRSARVIATHEGKADTAVVVVTAQVAARVLVTPDSVTVAAGESTTLAARIEAASGAVLTGRVITWNSADTSIATVSSIGEVTARPFNGAGARVTRVIATNEGVSDTSVVVVTPLAVGRVTVTPDSVTVVTGSATTLAVQVEDATGSLLTGRQVVWASTDTGVVTVSSSGVVSALAYTGPGTKLARVYATSEGRADTVVVVVTPLAVARVVVTPDSLTLSVGASATLSARVEASTGALLTERALVWSSTDTTIAAVSSAGEVTARPYNGGSLRVVRIIATSEGRADTVSVAVTPAPAARVVVSPAELTLIPGETATVTASVFDGQNVALQGRVVTWSSTDTSVVTVSSSGGVLASPYLGISARVASLIATSEGRADSVAVTVNPIPVASVAIAPDSLRLIVGEVGTLTASLRGAEGQLLTGRPTLWSIGDSTVATVSATGDVTARPYLGGETRRTIAIVVASGVADTVPIIVLPLSSARVEVSPDSVLLGSGQSAQLSVISFDGQGNALVGRTVEWSTLDAEVASVTTSGLVSAKVYGGADVRVARVVATVDGVGDTARVYVTPPLVTRIEVAPVTGLPLSGFVDMTGGDTLRLIASLFDSAGTPLSARRVSWRTNDDGRALVVDSTGLITASRRLDESNAPDVYAYADRAGVVCNPDVPLPEFCLVGSVIVNVRPLPVGIVNIGPDTITLTSGAEFTLAPTVLDINGATSLRPAWWRSGSPEFMDFIQCDNVEQRSGAGCNTLSILAYPEPDTLSGYIYLEAGGDFYEGLAPTLDSTFVIIRPLSVAALTLSPDTVGVRVGVSVRMTATVADSLGRELVLRPVVWETADTLVATVSVDGDVLGAPYSGAAERTTIVRATAEGRSDSAVVIVTPLPVSRVVATPDTVTIGEGLSVQLSAVAQDAASNILPGRPITWASADTSIATVNADGLVIGRVSTGVTRVVFIVASSEEKADTVRVTVEPIPVGFVIVSPTTTTVAAGRATTLQAEVRDSSANVLVGRPVTWTSRDTTVATVNAAGLVTVKPYSLVVNKAVTIVATSSGVSGEATINVTPAAVFSILVTPAAPTLAHRGSQQLSVTVRDSSGLTLEGRILGWSSADTSIATVSPTGLVEARPFFGAGVRTVEIRAASEGRIGTASIQVNPAVVSTVAIGPTPARLEATDTLQLISIPREINEIPLLGRSTAWVSADPGIATVTETGVVRPTAYVGGLTRTVNVTATVEGKQGTATVTVLPAPVRTVLLTPATSTILAGATRQITASLRDINNNALSGRTIAWTSSDTLIATVNAAGLVSSKPYFGAATRQVTITATAEGVSGTATVTMTPLVTTSLDVAPGRATLLPSESVNITAIPLDAGNRALTGRIANWSSSNPGVATVSPAGTVSAIALGSAVVTVVIDGLSASIPVSVVAVAPSVSAVSVTPGATQLWAGRVLELSAVPADSAGGALTGRTVTWSSSNPSIASVNETGVVSGLSLGFVNITATIEGRTGVLPLDVVAAPVSTITIAPRDTSVVIGRTVQLSAALRDSLGGTLTGRVLAWTSLNTSVATVNSSGLVTSVALGTAEIRAQSEGRVAATTVRVVPPILATLQVSPTAVSPRVGRTATIVPTLRDSAGVLLSQTGRAVTWASANDSIAVVSSTGVVTGIAVGTTTVSLTIDGLVAAIEVTVRPQAPVSVVVTPSKPNIALGQPVQLTATAFDNSGAAITRATTWVTDNPAIATVSQAGLVTPVSEGVVKIRATADSTVGLAEVFVSDTLWKTVASLPFSGEIANTVAYNPANGFLYVAKRPFDGVIYERRSSGQWVQVTPPQGTMGSCVTLHFDEARGELIVVGCGTNGVWRVSPLSGTITLLGSGGAAGGNNSLDAERTAVYSSIDQRVYAPGRSESIQSIQNAREWVRTAVPAFAEFTSEWLVGWAAGLVRSAAAYDQTGSRMFVGGWDFETTRCDWNNGCPGSSQALWAYDVTSRQVQALPQLGLSTTTRHELAFCADRNALVHFNADNRQLRSLRIGVDGAWNSVSTLRAPQGGIPITARTSTLICDPSRNRVWLVEAYEDGNRILQYPLPPL